MPATSANTIASQNTDTTRHVVLGTAGHIDHGKTSLVRALTGIDTDRLPEEKRRGMTIELGFAELRIADVAFGVVDVPGHEKFIRNMVAGATGIDVALIVVAADDSVMPQTIEHVEILDLLGVDAGVVAVTKRDLVDADMIGLVSAEINELLAGTRLSGAAVIPLSSTTGEGLEDLRAALGSAARRVAPRPVDRPFRMSVDRAFAIVGRGVVVTGSVQSGRLSAGDLVDILPVGRAARAREVQTHHRAATGVQAGERAAINLQGVELVEVPRGCELASPGVFAPTRWLDVELRCLASHPGPIRNHARLRVCLGTRELIARCVCLDHREVAPGESALVQLRFMEPVVATCGQRFIVRDENAARTAGGGIVLRAARRRISPRMTDEIDGLRRLRDADPAVRVAEVLRYHGFETPASESLSLAANVAAAEIAGILRDLETRGDLVRLAGVDHPLSAEFAAACTRRAAAWLSAWHARLPDQPGALLDTFTGQLERRGNRAFARAILQRMLDAGTIRVLGRYVCMDEFAPALSAEDERVFASLLDCCRRAAFQPPTIDELAAQTGANRQRIERLVRIAASLEQIVRIEPAMVLHADWAAEIRRRARVLCTADGAFTVSQLRAALDTTRKYAVPLAEYLDRIGFTRRQGDVRVVVQMDEPA